MNNAVSHQKATYRLIWLSYLGLWGPPVDRTTGRTQHHWRLHVLITYMEDLEDQVEICDLGSWDEFLQGLPGFEEYWDSPYDLSYQVHHYE